MTRKVQHLADFIRKFPGQFSLGLCKCIHLDQTWAFYDFWTISRPFTVSVLPTWIAFILKATFSLSLSPPPPIYVWVSMHAYALSQFYRFLMWPLREIWLPTPDLDWSVWKAKEEEKILTADPWVLQEKVSMLTVCVKIIRTAPHTSLISKIKKIFWLQIVVARMVVMLLPCVCSLINKPHSLRSEF